MAEYDKPVVKPAVPEQKGFQPKITPGQPLSPQGGYQAPTGSGVPNNPPNQGGTGKK